MSSHFPPALGEPPLLLVSWLERAGHPRARGPVPRRGACRPTPTCGRGATCCRWSALAKERETRGGRSPCWLFTHMLFSTSMATGQAHLVDRLPESGAAAISA
jgi:hypothetical protein